MAHMTTCGPHAKEQISVYDSPLYDALARVVRSFEDEEIGQGDLPHRPSSERRTRAQLGAMEQQLSDLPQKLEERVVPHFEQTERAIDETAEWQLDKAYSDSLPPDHLDRRHPVGSMDLRAARIQAAERKRNADARQLTLNPNCGMLIAQPPRAGLTPARSSALSALNPQLRLSQHVPLTDAGIVDMIAFTCLHSRLHFN